MYYYPILASRVPLKPYEIKKDYVLIPVKPLKKMWEGFTIGSLTPHDYDVVMAIPYIDGLSYDLYRDIIMFHSFISDDPETYVYGEYAFAFDKAFEGSELKIVKSKSVHKLDFDHYPMITGSAFEDFVEENDDDLPAVEHNTLSEQERSAESTPRPTEEINYREAFTLFTNLKSDKKKRKLYDQICLYVYLESFHNDSRLYCNDEMRVAFYIAILESQVGEPAQCSQTFCCEICKRNDLQHYRESLEQRFLAKYGESFEGLGDLRHMRHLVFHDVYYGDITDPIYDIYYQRQVRRKLFEKASTPEEKSRIYEEEKQSVEDEEKWSRHEQALEKLKAFVRKGLVNELLEQYRK